MQTNKVINQFIARFEALFPRFTFRSLRRLAPPQRSGVPYHLSLRLGLPAGQTLELGCRILRTGYREETERAVQRLSDWRERNSTGPLPALIAPFLAEQERLICQEKRIAYLDLEGNLSVDIPGTMILLERSGQRSAAASERRISPFTGKAERAARRLLFEPARVWKMRELAAACSISLGMASMATTALADIGAVVKTHSGVSLFNPSLLADSWVRAYRINRNPFQVLHSTEPLLPKLTRIGGSSWALTLWSGASIVLDQPLANHRLALYWMGDIAELSERLSLNREGGGASVFVFQPSDESLLWNTLETAGGVRVVDPLQLYLDLASGDEEELQLARLVREKRLAF